MAVAMRADRVLIGPVIVVRIRIDRGIGEPLRGMGGRRLGCAGGGLCGRDQDKQGQDASSAVIQPCLAEDNPMALHNTVRRDINLPIVAPPLMPRPPADDPRDRWRTNRSRCGAARRV